ncbi:hypothetical protein BV20DRAFT_710989 [Pilatotrama ljubarskyi]|nr:hypothetical protein BV20DRAFT_710989 [Pilatotrama ljubarskyi]
MVHRLRYRQSRTGSTTPRSPGTLPLQAVSPRSHPARCAASVRSRSACIPDNAPRGLHVSPASCASPRLVLSAQVHRRCFGDTYSLRRSHALGHGTRVSEIVDAPYGYPYRIANVATMTPFSRECDLVRKAYCGPFHRKEFWVTLTVHKHEPTGAMVACFMATVIEGRTDTSRILGMISRGTDVNITVRCQGCAGPACDIPVHKYARCCTCAWGGNLQCDLGWPACPYGCACCILANEGPTGVRSEFLDCLSPKSAAYGLIMTALCNSRLHLRQVL